MKHFFVTAWICLCSGLWLGYSGGASTSNQFRTAAPRTGGSAEGLCSGCHSGGNFGTSVKIEVFKTGTSTPVTMYAPNTNYDVQVTVNTTSALPSNGGYGFQMTAIRNDNSQAGTFGAPPSGMRVATGNSRQYAEHLSKSASNVFKISWKAPATGGGEVKFYASGNAVNGNSQSSGDLPANAIFALSEGTASANENTQPKHTQFVVFPNPSNQEVILSLKNASLQTVRYELFDLLGRSMKAQELGAFDGTKVEALDLKELPKGTYLLRLQSGNQVQTKTITRF